IDISSYSDLFTNPIAAIYTPFSFILTYEVYLLVYYLPKSTTTYIGKQYEIITLILIRRAFKDLANLKFTANWFTVRDDLQFTYDIGATLILFFLIFVFYKLSERRIKTEQKTPSSNDTLQFIKVKKIMATLLIPVLVALAIYSFGHWVYENFISISLAVNTIKDINKIFFDEFFTVLILTDVLLLLISFLQTDKFSTVIRNSGFIISTILLKLSFSIDGLLNTFLIVVAVLFGVAILAIHNRYNTIVVPEEE
ncbi:MAG: hypothetical protein H7319_07375, partial [Spirosoma sp.]|nr:hypothetical protein [Spirosoma sp.]